jgi:ABC-type nitrate/sulfonate/bicarbonate transport system permease component
VLFRLRLPAALPSIFTTCRFAVRLGLGLVVAYFSEGAALSNEGLSAAGKRAAAFNNWATVVTTAALGLIGLCTIAAAERATPRWQVSQRSVVWRCTGMQMCRWGNNSVKIDPMQLCYLHDR